MRKEEPGRKRERDEDERQMTFGKKEEGGHGQRCIFIFTQALNFPFYFP